MIKLKPFRNYPFRNCDSAYERFGRGFVRPFRRVKQEDIDYFNKIIYNKHLDRRLSGAYPVLDRREREKFGIVLLRGQA